MAVGIPGIVELTSKVETKIKGASKGAYAAIKADWPSEPNVEQILDRLRLYRELIGHSDEKEFLGIKGKDKARELDQAICSAISGIVQEPPKNDAQPHKTFAQWIHALHARRDYPLELFTTNYDLLFERGLEESSVPFFDGFVGSVEPFFTPECVESEETKQELAIYPPRSWTRIWKLHGSINWRLKTGVEQTASRIARVSLNGVAAGDELVIFPSREKYSESRKLPFLAFQDRLRRFLTKEHALLVILGYSFSDQHLNEIIFQGLRSNPRLAVTALMYGETDAKSKPSSRVLSDQIVKYGVENRNLALYGPDKACIGGIVAPWGMPSKQHPDWSFWNKTSKQFCLGDFNMFAAFVETFISAKTQPQVTSQPTEGIARESGADAAKLAPKKTN